MSDIHSRLTASDFKRLMAHAAHEQTPMDAQAVKETIEAKVEDWGDRFVLTCKQYELVILKSNSSRAALILFTGVNVHTLADMNAVQALLSRASALMQGGV